MSDRADSTAAPRGPLRLAGTFVVALLYAMIAIVKVRSLVRDLQGRLDARHWFIGIHLASGAVFFGVLAVVMIVRRPPVHRERRAVGWVLPIVVTIVFSLLGIPEPTGGSLPLVVVATIVTSLGTLATMYALSHLGRNFGVVADVRGFVAQGPYRWVRHPLYFGELGTTFGLLLLEVRPLTVSAFVIGTVLQIWRAKVEEHSLTVAFPAYATYAARTPMLIPRLWHRSRVT